MVKQISSVLTMSNLAKELGLKPERYFITREKGDMAYQIIKSSLMESFDNQPLILDFPPDQLIDASFTDSTIVRLLEELKQGDYGNKTIVINGLTEDSTMNVDYTLRMSKSKVAIISILNDGSWKILGKVEKSLNETLQLVITHEKLTAPELMDLIDIAVNTASNRLKRLFDLRLIGRDHEITENGLVYIYHFWEWYLPVNRK